MSNLLIPSYKQGFARNAAESEHPTLWDKLVGLWAPSLGPTGLTLRDWSGYDNHGTLTNMAPASDWVATEKGWALDFDGSNDYVVIADRDYFSPSVNPITASAWVKLPGDVGGGFAGGAGKYVLAKGAASNWEWGLEYEGGDIFGDVWTLAGGAYFDAGYTGLQGDNGWHFLAITIEAGDKLQLFVDGVLRATDNTSAGVLGNGTAAVRIAARGDGNYFDDPIGSAAVWNRALPLDEIQELYEKPHALLTLRRKVYASTAAPAGVAPTSHLYGSLVGPLGGAV